jgi:hypothetical protein
MQSRAATGKSTARRAAGPAHTLRCGAGQKQGRRQRGLSGGAIGSGDKQTQNKAGGAANSPTATQRQAEAAEGQVKRRERPCNHERREETHEAQRAARLAHRLRRGAERGREAAAEGRGMSGDAIRSGDNKTHKTRHAARPSHPLQRGAERGRGEVAERKRRERHCSQGVDEEMNCMQRAARLAHMLRRGAERGEGRRHKAAGRGVSSHAIMSGGEEAQTVTRGEAASPAATRRRAGAKRGSRKGEA